MCTLVRLEKMKGGPRDNVAHFSFYNHFFLLGKEDTSSLAQKDGSPEMKELTSGKNSTLGLLNPLSLSSSPSSASFP